MSTIESLLMNLRPGRVLDATMAHIFGWAYVSYSPDGDPRVHDPYGGMHCCPKYSTDLNDAWLLIRDLEHCDFNLRKDYDFEFWICQIRPPNARAYEIRGITAPHAICLAALKVKGLYDNGLYE